MNYESIMRLVCSCLNVGDTERALSVLHSCEAEGVTGRGLDYCRALVHLHLGQLGRARASLRRELKQFPGNEEAKTLHKLIQSPKLRDIATHDEAEAETHFAAPEGGALRVVHLCVQDFGGAGKAAYRLHKALQDSGVHSTMLVLNKRSRDPLVRVIPNEVGEVGKFNALNAEHVWSMQVARWNTLAGRYPQRPAGLEVFTDAESDIALSGVPDIEAADVVNFHWVAGIVDVAEVPRWVAGKPVVWTLHDMNPFTGGCHYAGKCQLYRSACGSCPQLGSQERSDLSYQTFSRKSSVYRQVDLTAVAPSQWLARCGRNSALLGGVPIHVVPNSVPTDVFKPYEQLSARAALGLPKNGRVVLFGADSITNSRKGLHALLAALDLVDTDLRADDLVLAHFGRMEGRVSLPEGLTAFPFGTITSEERLAQLYSAADVVVIPSLEDNLPNIALEALACGTPLAGFPCGGIKDIIVPGETGYLAADETPGALAKAIGQALLHGASIRDVCRRAAITRYSPRVQAETYVALYKGVVAKSRSRAVPAWRNGCVRREAREGNAVIKAESHARRGADAAIAEARILNLEGERLFKHDEVSEALTRFERANELLPEDAEIANNLAVCHWQLGDPGRALLQLARGLAIDPHNRNLILNGGQMLASSGRETDAKGLYASYLTDHPDDEEVATLLSAAESGWSDFPQTQAESSAIESLSDDEVVVSAIVSTFNSELYLRGCLDDLLSQTIADRIEIIIIDSASTQNEWEIVREYQQQHGNVTYIRTATRETIYAAWNRVVRAARGKYLTNANTDDRHRRDALERMAVELEARADVAVVYADSAVTEVANSEFDMAPLIGHFRWPDFDARRLFEVCYVGPQPMWRRDLHDVYGEFESSFEVAGDYEFWLRLVARERFYHIPEVLGLYLVSSGSLEHRNRQVCEQESELARARHWPESSGSRPVPAGGFLVPIAPPIESDAPPAVRAELSACSEQPLVSVVMPTRNRRELLPDALRSIAAQDYANWEVVIVNDGGEDVADLIEEYLSGKTVRYIPLSKAVGQVAARNAALRAARGDIICYLDDDDVYLPNHIGTIVRAIQQGEHAFVYTDADYATEVVENGLRSVVQRSTPYAHKTFSLMQLLVQNYIPINTWAHTRDCLWEIGLFDERMTCLEDWEFLLRLTSRYGALHIGATTVEVRVRGARSDSVSSERRGEFLPTFLEVYRRYPAHGSQELEIGRQQVLRGLVQEAIDNGVIVGSQDAVFQAVLRELYAGSREEGSEAQREPLGDRCGVDRTYQEWKDRRALQVPRSESFAECLLANGGPYPGFHLLVNVAPGRERQLADTLDSLIGQLYRGWGLTVIANSPAPDPTIDELDMIEWVQVTGDYEEAVEAVIEQSPSDWIALIESGDRLVPETLLCCARYIKSNPSWRFVYVDEDMVDADGSASAPKFKPDFNLDLLRSTPYIGNFCLIHREALSRTDSFDRKPSIDNYYMAFRVLETCGESAIGHIADVLFHRYRGNEDRIDATMRETGNKETLVGHLKRCGVTAKVVEGTIPSSYFVQYEHGANPLVTIIIPTKDRLDLLKPCVTSLLQKTTYPNYEVFIVDNNSTDPDTLCYLESLEVGAARVSVLRYPHAYNFSAINNFAVNIASGDYIVLLNNDTQVVQPYWLDRMMAHAQRPEVGIVGARLVYGDQKIQHAGVVLGMGGVAEHIHIGLSLTDPGYLGRAQVVQNFSAVTAACMVIRRSVYEQVGGLDDHELKVLFNDIDLCLKVGERGYKIVWTPFATLVHHGSSSIGEDIFRAQSAKRRAEALRMFERWLPKLGNDPAYNRNLSLKSRDPIPDAEILPGWDPLFHDRPRILGFPFDIWGCGEYRVRAPLRRLAAKKMAQTALVPEADARRLPEIGELARMLPDTLLLQSFVHDAQLVALEHYTKLFPDMFRVFELDDLKTQMPSKNPHQRTMYRDIKKRLRKALSFCNRMVVSTEPLKEAYGKMIDDIVVVPNYLERARWTGLTSQRRQGSRPRVGWAGAQQHHGDLEILSEVVRELEDEVEWIFFGMCPKALRPFISEFHAGVPIEQYPEKLSSLNLDLALAPLEHNKFNEAKSNLRLLEYGSLGWPVVATDIYPYRGAPVRCVANNADAWINAIREHVNDLDAAEDAGDQLRQWVMEEWILEDHLDCWLKALTSTLCVSDRDDELPDVVCEGACCRVGRTGS